MIPALTAAGAIAGIDWWAVHRNRRSVEAIAKPLVMVALIVVALLIDAEPAGARFWIVAGLGFGLVGDVCLLPAINRFVAGLGSFLVGHVLYAIGLALMVDGIGLVVLGIVIAAALITVMARPILAGLRGSRLRTPVTAYMVAVGILVVLGIASGRPAMAAGAVLFAVSDGLLGSDRFVQPAPHRRVVVHILYHLGQLGLVLGLHASFASTVSLGV